MPSESALLEQAAEYDPVVLGQIYDEYSEKIYNYIYYRVGDRDLAQDLMAEVFLKALDAIKVYRGWHTSLSGWLYRIAHNLVADHFRAKPMKEALPLDEQLIADEGNPALVVSQMLTQQRLRAAVNSLTEDQQQVVILKFVEEMSNADVARILGKTEGAVKSLQHRALASLRRYLEEQG